MLVLLSIPSWLAYTLSGAAVILILASLVLFFGSYYVLKNIIMKPVKRDDDFLIEYETKEKGFLKEWLDIPYKELWIDSDFGYKLHGKLYENVQNAGKKLIFLLHGHNNSSIGQLKYLEIFLNSGYSVFIPDHRFSGKSGGNSISFGHYEKHDVIKWMDTILPSFPDAFLGLFGESMGAATAIMVTAMDDRVKFLIEYCGFANFEELSKAYIKRTLYYKIIYPFFYLAARIFFNNNINQTNSYKAMKNVSVPTMIMHSKGDKTVVFSNAVKLKKANPEAEFVIFENSIHARSLMQYREKFIQSVNEFIKKVENNSKNGGLL